MNCIFNENFFRNENGGHSHQSQLAAAIGVNAFAGSQFQADYSGSERQYAN
jgi:hypothetical protein